MTGFLRTRIALGIAAAAATATTAPAQVEMRLRLAQSMVLHMEPILATVTIENGSSDEIAIGEGHGNSRFFFDIELAPGRPVPRTETPMFRRIAVVAPYKSATLEFDLLPLYELRTPGSYSVTARLHGPAGLLVSGRQFLDIVPGLEISQIAQTSPGGVRFLYQLRTLARDRQEHLFLRVDEEAASLCHGVFDLGTFIRVFQPVARFDRAGRVHVLHQSAPTRFTHSVFEFDGRPVSSVFWTAKAAEIALQRTEDGDIVVVGAQPYRGDSMVAPPRFDGRRNDPRR